MNKIWFFQGTSGAEEAYDTLSRYHKSLQKRVMSSGPFSEKLPLRDVDFGVDFEQKILSFSQGKGEYRYCIEMYENGDNSTGIF